MDQCGDRRWKNPPDFCKASFPATCLPRRGNQEWFPSLKRAVPREALGKLVRMGMNTYDPKTHKFEAIDLCYGQSHPILRMTRMKTIYFSLHDAGIGWFNTQLWTKTHDAAKAQGWCAPVIDYNGDGKTGPSFYVSTGDARTSARGAADPKLDRLLPVPVMGWRGIPIDHQHLYAG